MGAEGWIAQQEKHFQTTLIGANLFVEDVFTSTPLGPDRWSFDPEVCSWAFRSALCVPQRLPLGMPWSQEFLEVVRCSAGDTGYHVRRK